MESKKCITYTSWAKMFNDAIDILEGRLTLLSGIPENDVERFEATRDFFCKLTFTFLILALKDQASIAEVDSSLLIVMKFLFRTRNEDYLFGAIEDMFVGSGKKDHFYLQLCEALTELNRNGVRYHIRRDSMLRVLSELHWLGRIDIL